MITCIYRNSPWTCIGDLVYSNKPAITRYCAFLLLYLQSALLLHFRNMHFRWQIPFRKVFLTIRKMFRNVFLPVRMTISGTRISALLSPQVLGHAGGTWGEYRTRLVNEIVFFSAAAGSVGGVERYLGELNEFSKILNYRPQWILDVSVKLNTSSPQLGNAKDPMPISHVVPKLLAGG